MTKIEWAEKTWNPIGGCEDIQSGQRDHIRQCLF